MDVSAFGMGIAVSSYTLAINVYFLKKKGKAVAMSATVTALGSIVMPLVVDLLIDTYTIRDVTLIVAAISSHSFLAAALLQPVKWHLKREAILIIEKEEITESSKVASHLELADISE